MKLLVRVICFLSLFTSCSQNTSTDEFVSEEPIAFVNLNNRVTSRAANDSQDDYKLYASTSLSRNQWFIVDEVWGKTAGAYRANVPKKGPYYWLPLPYTFDFYAYAPANSRNIIIGDKFPDLRVAYQVSAQADEDFTVATPIKRVNYNGTSKAVDLVFNHMLAKVMISVALSDNLKKEGYAIASTNGANLAVVKTTGIIVLPESAEWGILPGSISNRTIYTGRNTYLIMPQKASDCLVQVKGVRIVKAGQEVFKGDLKNYPIKATDVKENLFKKGHAYQLNFVVDANMTDDDGSDRLFDTELTFSATSAGWTEVDRKL